jgi:hypothetical protein
MLSKNAIKQLTGLAAVLGFSGMASLALGVTLQGQQNTAIIGTPNATAYSATDGVTTLSRNDGAVSADHLQDMVQQWYFYSIGGGPNASIGTLSLLNNSAKDTNGDGLNDQLSLTYGNGTNNSVLIAVTYNLHGSGTPSNPSYQSNLTRSIQVRTTLSTPTNLSIYSLTDLKPTLIQQPTGGSVQEPGQVFAQQIGHGIRLFQNGASGDLVTDTLTSTDALNTPSHYEISTSPATLLAKLNGGVGGLASSFSSSSGPVVGGAGVNEIAYAFQYDLTGVTTGTYLTSETLVVTPEPASIMLLGLGGTMLVLRRRRSA